MPSDIRGVYGLASGAPAQQSRAGAAPSQPAFDAMLGRFGTHTEQRRASPQMLAVFADSRHGGRLKAGGQAGPIR